MAITIAEDRIEQLTALGEQQLAIVDQLGKLHMADVDARARLSEAQRALMADTCR